MNLLIDPNVSYVLLVIGLVLSVLALFSPARASSRLGSVCAGIGWDWHLGSTHQLVGACHSGDWDYSVPVGVEKIPSLDLAPAVHFGAGYWLGIHFQTGGGMVWQFTRFWRV